MKISGISNQIAAGANEGPLSLKKAIKAYKDNILTGLTDEEKEEIERLAREYLKERPTKTNHDREAFNNYVKSLLRKFGYKGDTDEYAAAVVSEISGALEEPTARPREAGARELYEKAAAGTAKNRFFLL